MSENRSDPTDGQVSRRYWRRCRPLAALLAVGIVSAGTALAVDRSNHSPRIPGGGCRWDNLKGDLAGAPKFVLALDGDFNVQGFYQSGGRGAPKDPPPEKAPDAVIELTKFGTATIYCYKINGKRECIEI